jgi:hypothetical protein
MANLLTNKVISTLPQTLTADTVYYVRVGNGFDIYITNSVGNVVGFPLNAAPVDDKLHAEIMKRVSLGF